MADFIIICDSREQWAYDKFTVPVEFGALKTGDYSIKEYQDRVSVERKTLNDIVGCLTVGRERFERELARSRELDYFALMIEATVKDIIHGNYWSKMLPKSAINSLLAFSIRYQLPIFFCRQQRLWKQVDRGIAKVMAQGTGEKDLKRRETGATGSSQSH